MRLDLEDSVAITLPPLTTMWFEAPAKSGTGRQEAGGSSPTVRGKQARILKLFSEIDIDPKTTTSVRAGDRERSSRGNLFDFQASNG